MRQISPSTTAFGLFTALAIAFATPGKRVVRSLSLRETSLQSPPRTYASARNPSNFTSCVQSTPAGMRVSRVASIGLYVPCAISPVSPVVVTLDQQPVLFLAVQVRGNE